MGFDIIEINLVDEKNWNPPPKVRMQNFQYQQKFDIFKDLKDDYWTIRDHLGSYLTLQDYTVPFGTMQNNM